MVRTTVQVLRDGRASGLALVDVVPGDVVVLSAGGVIPADGILLQATNLYVDQAASDRGNLPGGEAFGARRRDNPAG